MQDKWVIIGCGGHARSVADVILFNHPDANIVFLDKNAHDSETLLGFRVLKEYEITDEKVIVALGDNIKRRELCEKYYSHLESVISKNAYISKFAKIGKGVFVAHNAHIGVLSEIEDFSIINTGALIDHECIIKKAAFIGPKATLCGKITIEENVFIGAGATVVPDARIEKNIIVGAQALVAKNVLLNKNEKVKAVYVGVPAKKIGDVE